MTGACRPTPTSNLDAIVTKAVVKVLTGYVSAAHGQEVVDAVRDALLAEGRVLYRRYGGRYDTDREDPRDERVLVVPLVADKDAP